MTFFDATENKELKLFYARLDDLLKRADGGYVSHSAFLSPSEAFRAEKYFAIKGNKDRICFFGDGIYDATYSRNYKIFTVDEHIDRFYNSAEQLEIKLPYTKAEMRSLLEEMVMKMDTGNNFVYFQATRGSDAVRSHVFPPESVKANIWINIYPKLVSAGAIPTPTANMSRKQRITQKKSGLR